MAWVNYYNISKGKNMNFNYWLYFFNQLSPVVECNEVQILRYFT